MGYLNFITDRRNPGYVRLYVGQCSQPYRRIISQHAQAVSQGSVDSLHYFILWLGNGDRTANFLRLWSFPEGQAKDQWYKIRSNLLECLFCKAFASDHGMLETPTSRTLNQEEKGFGLNIMSPLLQGVLLTNLMKERANAATNRSLDLQIRHWTIFRESKRRDLPKSWVRTNLFRMDYCNALQAAIGADLFASVSLNGDLDSESRRDGEAAGDAIASIPFIGSLSAKIGWVLDYAAVSPSSDLPLDIDGIETSKSGIPWSLKGCHFDETNTLIWTYNFQKFSILAADDFRDASSDIEASNLHQALIDASQLRVVLMCGPRAEKAICAVIKNLSRHTLKLRGYRYPLYVESGTGTISQRLYIRCPELPSHTWSVNPSHAGSLSDAIKFATSMTMSKAVRPYFIEASSVVGLILASARRERLGGPRMTVDTMDDGIRMWLSRKGICEEKDLRMIEEIAGSLTRGLLMVLHALPRRGVDGLPSLETRPARVSTGKRVRCYEPFDREVYKSIRRHVNDLVERNNQNYKDRLSALPQDSLPPSDNVIEVDENDSFAAIDSFTQKDGMSSEPLVEVESLLRQRRNNILMADREIPPKNSKAHQTSEFETDHEGSCEADYEACAEDLAPLIQKAIERGFLEAADGDISQSTGLKSFISSRNRTSSKGQLSQKGGHSKKFWRDETTVFRDKEYQYSVSKDAGSRREVRVNYCPIIFPLGVDVGDGTVYIQIEICEAGLRHPSVYATAAKDEDPASRLAFKVRFKDSSGSEITYYETNSNITPLFRANAFVDILADEKPDEIIAQTPRRYLKIPKGCSLPGLKEFVGGRYTSPTTRL